jgi:NADH dehydrogenase (ubiquinone) flavoprotein 2
MTERFEFSGQNLERAKAIIACFPDGRQQSAVLPLLDLAQRQNGGHVDDLVIDAVADMLGMPRIRVVEVTSFYTMINTAPVGKHHLQCCTTTPCWLRGSAEVVDAIRRRLGIDFGETTPDGLFSMVEVECVGACVNAPVVQINDDFYEDLDAARIESILDDLKADRTPRHGPQVDRQASAPRDGATTLTDLDFPGE